MTDTESAPVAGSRVGRYVIIREVAPGTYGPLYIAEREVGDGVEHGLARVVILPPELPAKDEQTLADAIWDSTNLAHNLVLRVADVVTGKSWLTLIHEYSEGSLLDFLQSCASQAHSPFPAKVAARIALDVIDGLEQSRDHCATAAIPWRPGSVAPGSLLLGPDGRVRALDGQIAAAALRVPALRALPGAAVFAAPEMLEDTREPSERSDVFSIGVLLWELLTGVTLFGTKANALDWAQNFKFRKITQFLPPGTKVPQGLIHAVHTALEPEPLKRQASLRELAVAIVMGVEEVATYEQVVEFVDAISKPTPEEESRPEARPPEYSAHQEALSAKAGGGSSPIVAQLAAPELTSAEPLPTSEIPLLDRSPSAPESPPNGQPQAFLNASDAKPDSRTQSEPPHRDKLDTLPGYGSTRPADVESRPSTAPTPATQADAPRVASQPGPAASSPPRSEPFRLVSEEPFVPLAALPVQSIIDPPSQNPPTAGVDSRRSDSLRPAPARSWDDPSDSVRISGPPPKRTLQVSMGTLILGFSTTVLAVIVIMLAMQRSSGPAAKEVPAPSSASTQQTPLPADMRAQGAGVPNAERASADDGKESDSGVASQSGTKGEHHKRTAKDQARTPGKSTNVEDTPPSGEFKAAGQPSNKHYIPNEL